MMQAPVPVFAWVATLCLLGGCSVGSSVTVQGGNRAPMSDTTASPTERHSGERFASVTLDDHQLGAIRGGFDTGSGAELRFGYQQATYLNGTAIQSVVQPTITLPGTVISGGFVPTPGSATVPPADTTSAPGPDVGLPATGGTPITAVTAGTSGRPNLDVPYSAVGTSTYGWLNFGSSSAPAGSITPGTTSLANAGATSIVTTLGGGGLSNVIGNTANGQLVQQVTKLDISTNGLSGLLQSARSPLLDGLRNTQFLPR